MGERLGTYVLLRLSARKFPGPDYQRRHWSHGKSMAFQQMSYRWGISRRWRRAQTIGDLLSEV
jgi:hypothetical protein